MIILIGKFLYKILWKFCLRFKPPWSNWLPLISFTNHNTEAYLGLVYVGAFTAKKKMKFSIKDFFSSHKITSCGLILLKSLFSFLINVANSENFYESNNVWVSFALFQNCDSFTILFQVKKRKVSISPFKGFFFRSSRPEVFSKQLFVKVSQNSQENTCVRVSFFNKVAGWGLQLYLKKDSSTGVFLRIYKIFLGTVFLTEHLLQWLILFLQSIFTFFFFRKTNTWWYLAWLYHLLEALT